MTGPERILVVDDEVQIRRALKRALDHRGYLVDEAEDGESALLRVRASSPDLVVLDLNLPGLGGIEVCRRIRERGAVPILVLSVRADEGDKVQALDLGADDYLTKPFGIDELLARVRALLRRSSGFDKGPSRFEIEKVVIDPDEHVVLRDGSGVRLTRTEWALLKCLCRYPGRLQTHGWILEAVWGAGHRDDIELLRVFISQLRRKIEPDPDRPAIIVTDPGVGYRWTLRPLS